MNPHMTLAEVLEVLDAITDDDVDRARASLRRDAERRARARAAAEATTDDSGTAGGAQ